MVGCGLQHPPTVGREEIPAEVPGEYARVQMTLVDASSGIIRAKRAKRVVRMARAVTQAMREALQEQMQTPFSRFEYEGLVQQVYARYPDSDALLKDAQLMEAVASENY